jgi:hypothetical protein
MRDTVRRFGPCALAGFDHEMAPETAPPFRVVVSNAGMGMGVPVAHPHPVVVTMTVGDDHVARCAVEKFEPGQDAAALDFMLAEAKRLAA